MEFFARLALLGLVGVALAAATVGSLDSTFDGDGLVMTEPTDPIGWGHFSSVAVQADRKVVAAGTETGPQSIFVVARYNKDGSLDESFGDASLGEFGYVTPFGNDSSAKSVVLDSSGCILVLGYATIDRETGKGKKKRIERVGMLALVRLDVNGILDDTFGDGGIVLVENAGAGVALALQADGSKIVAVGRIHEVTSSKKKGRPTAPTTNDSLALVRFHADDGALDTSFDGDGIVIDNTAENSDMDALIGVGLQSDDSIIVSGIENGAGFLRRYDSNGKVDGLLTLGDARSLPSLVIDAFDRILVAGSDSSGNGIVERYSADGVLDTSFGNSTPLDGRYTTGEGALRGVFLLPDDDSVDSGGGSLAGRIVACGQTGNDGFVLRLTSDGDLDPTYGISALTTPGDGLAEAISDCAVDLDGNYVICGGKIGVRFDPDDPEENLLSDFFLARYCGN